MVAMIDGVGFLNIKRLTNVNFKPFVIKRERNFQNRNCRKNYTICIRQIAQKYSTKTLKIWLLFFAKNY
jgi:hypothetical protein